MGGSESTAKDVVEYVREVVPTRARLDSAVLEFAALDHGLAVKRIKRTLVLVELPVARLPFVGLHGPDSSTVARSICGSLTAQRALATVNGVATLPSLSFTSKEIEAVERWLASARNPVQVKVAGSTRSGGQVIDVRAPASLRNAAAKLHEHADELIVEEVIQGDRYRIFVVDGVVVSAARFVPASVVGDGLRSLADLIAAKNEARAGNPAFDRAPVPMEREHLDALDSRVSLDEVPSEGRVLRLQSMCDESSDIVSVTPDLDPRIGELAIQSLSVIPGLPYAGVDIVVPAEGEPLLDAVRYGAAPIGQFPSEGPPADIGAAVIRHYLSNAQWERARNIPHKAA